MLNMHGAGGKSEHRGSLCSVHVLVVERTCWTADVFIARRETIISACDIVLRIVGGPHAYCKKTGRRSARCRDAGCCSLSNQPVVKLCTVRDLRRTLNCSPEGSRKFVSSLVSLVTEFV